MLEQVKARFNPPWPAAIDCGEGWFDIIERLDARLAQVDPNYTIAQIKEKFGGLRFYPDVITGDRELYNRYINEAEQEASRTCEVCGEYGILRSEKMWWRTLCDNHA